MKRKLIVTGMALLAVTGVALALPLHERMHGESPLHQMFDADGDGEVTRAEIEQGRAAQFAKADTDGNGTLSAQELEQATEAMRKEMMQRRFTMLDADGDGEISAKEFESRKMGRYMAMHKKGCGAKPQQGGERSGG